VSTQSADTPLSGGSRKTRIARHLVGLAFFRSATFLLNLAVVPFSLAYLLPAQYGIWVTLSSIVGWMGSLDMGIGNGLRNNISACLAIGDLAAAREHVSTAFAYLGGGAIIGTFLFELVNPFIDWVGILKAEPSSQAELRIVAGVVFCLWGLRLAFGLVSSILLGDRRPASGAALDAISTLLSVVCICFLPLYSKGSLVWFSIAASASFAVVPVTASILLFRRRYRAIAPRLRYVRRERGRELTKTGIQFFVLQVAGVVLVSSANVIVTHMFGPEEVTPFYVASRFFNIPLMVSATLLLPFWSEYSDAYFRGDLSWIGVSLGRLRKLWWALFGIVVVLVLFARPLIQLWVGNRVNVPWELAICLGVYVLMQSWCNIYINVINGTGRILLQVILAVGTTALFVPTAIIVSMYFVRSSAGVVVATCCMLAPLCVLWPIQVRKVLTRTTSGIWAK
jgi:O-antigen/teichoic acid export membrane protein